MNTPHLVFRAIAISNIPSSLLRDPFQNTQEHLKLKQEWKATTSELSWNVKPEDLEMLPEYFPLERTHRVIEGVSSVQVSERIAKVLRDHSIHAEYECAKAKCKTNDLVSFRISLYSGGENGEPVIVEIQRRCGSARSFLHVCRMILDGAEDKTSSVKKTFDISPDEVKSMACLKDCAVSESTPLEPLPSTIKMLESNEVETQLLALENLVSLTDLTKTSFATTVSVSEALCLGHETYHVRERIAALIKSADPSDRWSESLMHLAFNCLSNALEVCTKGSRLQDVSVQRWFQDNLLLSFTSAVADARQCSCNAYFAARCLSVLLSLSPSIVDEFCRLGGKDALIQARDFGLAQHKLLHSVCDECLRFL